MKRGLLFLGVAAMLVLVVAACGPKHVKSPMAVETPPPPQPVIAPPPETIPPKPETAAKAPTPAAQQPTPASALTTIHFDFDKFVIRPSDAKTLDANAAYLRANAGVSLTLEGYCDPTGTEEYNRGLGLRRANAAREYLVKAGISSDRLSVISYGEDNLVTTDTTKFELDRRVEFKPKP